MEPFFNAILPVFAVVGVGYLCAHLRFLDRDAAVMLNRFVFYVAVPALLFRLVVTADLEAFDPGLVALFVGIELVVLFLGFLLGRFTLGLAAPKALLVGLAACFTNHVFLVLPIAVFLYGEAAAAPIVGIITVDAALILAGCVLTLDLMTSERKGGVGPALAQVVRATLTNTMVIAVAAGLAYAALGLPFHAGLDKFTGFLAGGAAPAGLVALGIILHRTLGAIDQRTVATITALKLLVFPALGFGLVVALAIPLDDAQALLMVAAGPAGAMPLILATRYGFLVDEIARAILITTVFGLFTVTAVTML
ncbi:MAG: AEC family transporter [Pseudomonadota bacterium]